MFRGKESSNRIKLFQLVKELLNFGDLGSLWLWSVGVVDGGVGVSRCVPTCPYIHAHADMHMHMHNTKIYMYSNCKWPPPWRHPCLSCLTCMCICACIHTCMHMCACTGHPHTLTPTHTLIHPPHPSLRGVTSQIS